MNKRQLVDDVKARFGVGENNTLTYIQEDGDVIALSPSDIENIRIFADFKRTGGFITWFKYKLKGNL